LLCAVTCLDGGSSSLAPATVGVQSVADDVEADHSTIVTPVRAPAMTAAAMPQENVTDGNSAVMQGAVMMMMNIYN